MNIMGSRHDVNKTPSEPSNQTAKDNVAGGLPLAEWSTV